MSLNVSEGGSASPAPVSTPAAQPAASPQATTSPVRETKVATPTPDTDSVADRLRKNFTEKVKELDAPKESKDQKEPAKKPDAPKAADVAVTTPADEPAAEFKPNFKLKVMDKEMEIPEEFRSLIKDKESEKQVREIFEKAYGLDHAKPKHIQTQKELQEVRVQHQQVATRMQTWEANLGKLTKAAESSDPIEFEQFLSFWKIPKEKLYEHTARLLQYDELDPATRAAEDQRKQEILRGRQAQEQLQAVQGQASSQAVQMRLGQVDQLITRPDISQVAREYDARRGNAPTFKELVVERGQLAASRRGVDLSAEEAIREVMSLLGYEEAEESETPAASQAPQGQQPQAPITTQPAAQRPKSLPTLPTVGAGNGTAPVKKAPNSIADLKRMRSEMSKAK